MERGEKDIPLLNQVLFVQTQFNHIKYYYEQTVGLSCKSILNCLRCASVQLFTHLTCFEWDIARFIEILVWEEYIGGNQAVTKAQSGRYEHSFNGRVHLIVVT